MKILTKRFKKNKMNKTIKKGGATKDNVKTSEITIPESNNEEREGIFDFIGNKIKSGISSIARTGEDAGLRLIGLERVSKAKEEKEIEEKEIEEKEIEEKDKSSMVNDKINELSEATSGVLSDVKNVADKTSAAVIENINEVLGSDEVKESVKEAAENTVNILKDNAKIFNEALNNPEVKEELKKAIDNAADIGTVAVKAAEKPFNEAIDVAAEAIPKAAASSLAGVIKVGTDALGAVPGFGAIIDIGKMVNDGTKAVSGVVEATTDAIEAGSDLIINTKENFENGMKLLEKNKKMAEEISNRNSRSIKDFESPLNKAGESTGGGRTRRRLRKHKGKSKRVRFSL
jgi:hypothetical protein